MSELKALKNKVFAYYATIGKTSKSLINDLVRQHGDLRRIATWQSALDAISTSLDAEVKAVLHDEETFITPDQFTAIALELALLPEKTSTVTPDQFASIALELALLPNKREVQSSMLTDYDRAMQECKGFRMPYAA